MLRCVIFDLGRTLVPFSFDPLTPALQSRRDEAFQLFAAYETGQIDSNRFERELRALARIQPNFAEWWCSIFTIELLIPEEVLRRIKDQVRLGLISNTNELHFEFLRREMPQLSLFDFFTLSYKVGAVKPSPAIYTSAEEMAQCRPNEILYFDDIPEYVEAARRRGWNAEVFTGQAGVEAAVQRHGLSLGSVATAQR